MANIFKMLKNAKIAQEQLRSYDQLVDNLEDRLIAEREQSVYYRRLKKENKLAILPCAINETIYIIADPKDMPKELHQYSVAAKHSEENNTDLKIYMLTVKAFILKDNNVLYFTVKESDYGTTGFMVNTEKTSVFTALSEAINKLLNNKIPDDVVTEVVNFIGSNQ